MAVSSKWEGQPPSLKHKQVRRHPERPTKLAKRKIRKAAQRKRALANAPVFGLQRPLSGLDEQAKALGVYDQAYHCLNRTERKSIVSTALTKSKAA